MSVPPSSFFNIERGRIRGGQDARAPYMKFFRKILFWLHLASGVLAGIVIFIMCVTGAALSFEKNLTEYFEKGKRYVAVPDGAQRLGPQEILAKVLAVKPNAKPSGITMLNRPDAAAQVALG